MAVFLIISLVSLIPAAILVGSVYKVVENDIIKKTEVKTGTRDKGNLEVVNGLAQGDNVVAEGLEGGLKADKMNFDLTEKKLRISMYNEDKVNIKVNY